MIIKDHVKFDATVSPAKRIPNTNKDSTTPGVVIATFDNKEKRVEVLRAKRNLNSSIFKDVYIHEDQSKEERVNTLNLRIMVNAIKRGEHISLRGNRVVRSQQSSMPRGDSRISGAHNNGTNTSGAHNNGTNVNTQNSGSNNGAANGAGNNSQSYRSNNNDGYRGNRGGNRGNGGYRGRGQNQRGPSNTWRGRGNRQ